MPRITDGDQMRLDDMAAHLSLSLRWGNTGFEHAVVAGCLKRVRPIIEAATPKNGEGVCTALARHLGVRFEEVRGQADVDHLEKKYLHGKKELGFARLRTELQDPEVDALLFQRRKATERDDDQWVAVLNLQHTEAKAYWDRMHELVHRIAEPPQKALPFRRHGLERDNPLERLIDLVAAEIAFYRPLFEPIVRHESEAGVLSFAAVERIRERFAPSASLLAVANAVVKLWPAPAMVVTATYKGRKKSPESDRALRVAPQARNGKAELARLYVFPNMRVPATSPIHDAFTTGLEAESREELSTWSTSKGDTLPDMTVFTSAVARGGVVYGLLSA